MKNKFLGANILVVEDDVVLLDLLCNYFQINGATIFRAANGHIAFQVIENERIDFVLSDVQMPVMDGVELLKKIRIKHSHKPIVLLATGQCLLTEAEAMASGASGLIHKPFGLKEVTEKIGQLLQMRNDAIE